MISTPRKVVENRLEHLDAAYKEVLQDSWSQQIGKNLEAFWDSIYDEDL